MRSIRTILVAIKDPSARSIPALQKAAQLARGLDARLALFHALTWPVHAATDQEFQEIRDREQARVLQRLEQLAGRLNGRGRRKPLAVSVAAEWDRPAYEAVVRHAMAIRADLIVAERHAGHRVAPALLHFNDWELLRQSPVPLLIVKRPGIYRKPAVLAAVDPLHDMDKPRELDAGILDVAAAVSSALSGRLHAVHAYEIVYERLRPAALDDKAAATTNSRIVAAARQRYQRLLGRYRIPRTRGHLVNMAPADAIETVAARLGSQIVVLGAISRSGWKRLLIGNTAETVLDPLRCDVLIVKPPKFRTQVEPTVQGARFVPTASLMVA